MRPAVLQAIVNAMARYRAAVVVGMLTAGAVIALSAVNCASPTQIIVDVRADESLCDSIRTGIAVTTLTNIDTDKLEVFQNGCQKRSEQVGSLTISPSGAKDEWVGIRIVGAINGHKPDQCGLTGTDGKPDWSNCVLARRTVQFSPGKTVNVTVPLGTECVGRYCGGAQECSKGLCVQPSQIQPDGGLAPPTKDGDVPIDDVFVPDAPSDAPVVDDKDACARCTGPGASCSGGTLCTYNCTASNCSDRTLCAPGLDCRIACGQGDKCKGTTCATDRSCEFQCTGNQDRCEDIACSAASCNVSCSQNEGVCKGVFLDGGVNAVNCIPADDKPTCDDVRCTSGVCKRQCNDAGCGPATTCTGNCDAWEDAAPPPPPPPPPPEQ
jgi:hypothetical protein